MIYQLSIHLFNLGVLLLIRVFDTKWHKWCKSKSLKKNQEFTSSNNWDSPKRCYWPKVPDDTIRNFSLSISISLSLSLFFFFLGGLSRKLSLLEKMVLIVLGSHSLIQFAVSEAHWVFTPIHQKWLCFAVWVPHSPLDQISPSLSSSCSAHGSKSRDEV